MPTHAHNLYFILDIFETQNIFISHKLYVLRKTSIINLNHKKDYCFTNGIFSLIIFFVIGFWNNSFEKLNNEEIRSNAAFMFISIVLLLLIIMIHENSLRFYLSFSRKLALSFLYTCADLIIIEYYSINGWYKL